MKKICFLFCLLSLWVVNLNAQDNKIITVNSDLFRASYEKISEEAFDKLWEESVSQQIKITLLDNVLKIQLKVGGGIVSFDELKTIPELKEMMINGTFPEDRLFIKHVCEVEFGVNTNLNTLLEAGVAFPFRVTYIESIASEEGKNPLKVKNKSLLFFKNYIDLMLNRVDKSVMSLENSLLPSNLILKTGEQFSVERFLLGYVSLGAEAFDFKVDNPVLHIEGAAKFLPVKFSKTLMHARMTVQNFGLPDQYRLTVTKKKISTLEFLNTNFGFTLKTKKKLFNLMRLNVSVNFFKFSPTWNYYKYQHRQFLGDFDDIKTFNNVKRVYTIGENNFLNNKLDKFEFFRNYQVRGHSFSNELNIFNFYRNNHLEKIENRFIDSNLNTRENIGVGSFNRVKSNLFASQRMSLNIAMDYSYQFDQKHEKEDRSGLVLKFLNDDGHGMNEAENWYMQYTRKMLEDYFPDATSEFDFLLKNADGDQFKRQLTMRFDAVSFHALLTDRKKFEKKCEQEFIKYFMPNKNDSKLSKWRKEYIRAMLTRTLDRLHVMNELLDLQFKARAQSRFSVNRLKTPGQLPMQEVVYLLIASAVGKENISFEYTINRIPERNSLMEPFLSKTKYTFNFTGKDFKSNFDQLEFYY